MSNSRGIAAAIAAALLCSSAWTTAVTPAEARISAGNISLKVTGKCPALGDSITSFTVWTPEKGMKKVTSGKTATTKTATIDFGTFKKDVKGDTYFNWTLDCRFSGRSGSHQKKYGGNPIQTNYSFTIANDKGKIKYP